MIEEDIIQEEIDKEEIKEKIGEELEEEDLSKPLKINFNLKKLYIVGGVILGLVIIWFIVKTFILTINGKGNFKTEEMMLDIFESVEMNIPANLYIKQGDPGFKIIAEETILDKLVIESKDGKLYIGKKPFYILNPTASIEIYISTNAIDKLTINGSGTINGQDQIIGNKLELIVNGSADVNLNVRVNNLLTKVKGAGDVYYRGEAKNHEINISGSSTVKSFDMICKKVKINVSGSGICEVFASENLDVKISGSGKIYYKGEPKIDQSVSGAGKIRKSENN